MDGGPPPPLRGYGATDFAQIVCSLIGQAAGLTQTKLARRASEVWR